MALEILLAYHFPEDSGLLFENATVRHSAHAISKVTILFWVGGK